MAGIENNNTLSPGQIVHVRSRQFLVEDVTPAPVATGDTLVCLACLEDDAQGEALEVFWEREIDAQMIEPSSWEAVAHKGFDNPRYFSAYLHALRWNCVTSTEPKLFQAPYRAGIEVKAYQQELVGGLRVALAAEGAEVIGLVAASGEMWSISRWQPREQPRRAQAPPWLAASVASRIAPKGRCGGVCRGSSAPC